MEYERRRRRIGTMSRQKFVRKEFREYSKNANFILQFYIEENYGEWGIKGKLEINENLK